MGWSLFNMITALSLSCKILLLPKTLKCSRLFLSFRFDVTLSYRLENLTDDFHHVTSYQKCWWYQGSWITRTRKIFPAFPSHYSNSILTSGEVTLIGKFACEPHPRVVLAFSNGNYYAFLAELFLVAVNKCVFYCKVIDAVYEMDHIKFDVPAFVREQYSWKVTGTHSKSIFTPSLKCSDRFAAFARNVDSLAMSGSTTRLAIEIDFPSFRRILPIASERLMSFSPSPFPTPRTRNGDSFNEWHSKSSQIPVLARYSANESHVIHTFFRGKKSMNV